jgi:hypothetical protein
MSIKTKVRCMKSFLSLSTNKARIASNGEIDSIYIDFYYVIGRMN